MSLHYYAHGVALNQNFTRAFFQRDKEDCEPCESLAAHVEYGVSSYFFVVHILIHILRRLNSASLNDEKLVNQTGKIAPPWHSKIGSLRSKDSSSCWNENFSSRLNFAVE